MTTDVRQHVVAVIEEAGGLHTMADLAKRWGITRARVNELTQHPGFPDPLIYVGKSPLFLGGEADAWREQVRPPGRPARRANAT